MNSEKPKKTFWLHVVNVMTGVGLAQAVNVGVYPILTRIYSPEDFGVLALITSLAVPLSVTAGFGYEPAIVLPKSRGEAQSILTVCQAFILVSVIALFVVIEPLRNPLSDWLKASELVTLALWFPVATAVLSLNRVYDYWLARERLFPLMAVSKVTGASAGALTKVGLGLVTNGASVALLIGFMACEVCKAMWVLIRTGRDVLPRRVSWKASKDLLATYSNLPKFHLPHLLLHSLVSYVPFVVFSALFGANMVGLFSLGMRMVLVPIELTTQSVAQVFYQRSVAEVRGGGDLAGLVAKTTGHLVLIGMGPFLLMSLSGQWLFHWIFGSQWVEAGLCAQILAPAVFFEFVSTPVVLFNTLGRQKEGLIWQAQYFILTVVALVLGALAMSETVAVVLLSLAILVAHVRLLRVNFTLCGARWSLVLHEMESVIRRLARKAEGLFHG
ncbi:MAG: oligosaccharide flippase family protein [Deltaproteobacteria bacterium]|nr:oligosaccharide flippase family protein [Deltaproteobacteria bacterium]